MRKPLSAEALSNLIGMIYDCALDPGRWLETLTHVRNELDFAGATLALTAMPSGDILLNVMTGPDTVWLDRLPQYGADAVECWGGAERVLNLPLEEPLVLSWLRERSDWENNRFYLEWLKPQGFHDTINIILTRDPTMLGTLGFGRHDMAGAIGDLEVDAVRLLIPHVRRAVAISKLLNVKSVAVSTFESALDAFAVGVVLTTAELGIVHVNAAAEAMLSAGDPIRSEHGTLAMRSPVLTTALGCAVRQAAENEAGMGRRGLGVPAARADGTPCVLYVLPLRRGALRPDLMPRAAAAIFVAPAVCAMPAPEEALAALFDFTPAEARVFAQIAAGRTLSESTKTLCIETTTAKTHLAHIFAKTGTRRQADLITLGAALALPVRP